MNAGSPKFDQALRPVFPSKNLSIWGTTEAEYPTGPAHQFKLQNSLGFNDGEAQYDDSYQELQFVQKNEDGTMIPGVQSEQLLIALIARHQSLNTKFPSRHGSMAITFMEQALWALQARVQERMDRGVMGELKQ